MHMPVLLDTAPPDLPARSFQRIDGQRPNVMVCPCNKVICRIALIRICRGHIDHRAMLRGDTMHERQEDQLSGFGRGMDANCTRDHVLQTLMEAVGLGFLEPIIGFCAFVNSVHCQTTILNH